MGADVGVVQIARAPTVDRLPQRPDGDLCALVQRAAGDVNRARNALQNRQAAAADDRQQLAAWLQNQQTGRYAAPPDPRDFRTGKKSCAIRQTLPPGTSADRDTPARGMESTTRGLGELSAPTSPTTLGPSWRKYPGRRRPGALLGITIRRALQHLASYSCPARPTNLVSAPHTNPTTGAGSKPRAGTTDRDAFDKARSRSP